MNRPLLARFHVRQADDLATVGAMEGRIVNTTNALGIFFTVEFQSAAVDAAANIKTISTYVGAVLAAANSSTPSRPLTIGFILNTTTDCTPVGPGQSPPPGYLYRSATNETLFRTLRDVVQDNVSLLVVLDRIPEPADKGGLCSFPQSRFVYPLTLVRNFTAVACLNLDQPYQYSAVAVSNFAFPGSPSSTNYPPLNDTSGGGGSGGGEHIDPLYGLFGLLAIPVFAGIICVSSTTLITCLVCCRNRDQRIGRPRQGDIF